MIRTFSKIYGLSGLRLGWAYCSTEVSKILNRVRNPFNVNTAAQEAGIAALKDTKFIHYLKENENEILFEGVLEMFQRNQNRKIAIGLRTKCTY